MQWSNISKLSFKFKIVLCYEIWNKTEVLQLAGFYWSQKLLKILFPYLLSTIYFDSFSTEIVLINRSEESFFEFAIPTARDSKAETLPNRNNEKQ